MTSVHNKTLKIPQQNASVHKVANLVKLTNYKNEKAITFVMTFSAINQTFIIGKRYPFTLTNGQVCFKYI